MVQYAGNDDVTFRYNEWWNWSVEGIMVWTQSGALVRLRQRVPRRRQLRVSRASSRRTTRRPALSISITTRSPTSAGTACSGRRTAVGWTSDSQARNNLYWNSDVCVQSAPSSDYDACYDDLASSNQSTLGISETTTVDAGGGATRAPSHRHRSSPRRAGDFHLTSNTPAGENARIALRRGQGRQREDDVDARGVRVPSVGSCVAPRRVAVAEGKPSASP